MYQETITMDSAKRLESKGTITIVDASPSNIPPMDGNGRQWKENFIHLQTKARHISPDKLISFFSAKYLIEVNEGLVDPDTNTYSWRYLHGIENKAIKSKTADNIEYVYILVNPGYPSLVKIGMTIHDVRRRVKGINATATVDEWVPKFALPVRKGTAMKVEKAAHDFFTSVRVSSDHGGKREFFTLSPLTAFDKVREIGALFQVGEPIIY